MRIMAANGLSANKSDKAQFWSEPHHLSSYIGVCDFSPVQLHLGGREGNFKKKVSKCLL